MSNFKRQAGLAALLASTALGPAVWAVPAAAQEAGAPAAADAAAETETVIVTARRREESLQDVPVAVSSFSAAKIEAAGAPDITILQQVSPNTTMQVARGSNSTLIAFIRGVGQQDPLWGFEPGVGLYVDDVYVARPQGAVLDIFDIERIEVLRGPQGTLYGRNTIGGAVKYVTRGLAADPMLRVRAAIGSYDQRDLIVSGSTPIGDTLKVGGALALYRRDGFGQDVVTGAEHYNKDVDAGRLSLEWDPTDAFSVRLAWDRTVDNSNARHGHREAAGSGLTAGQTPLPNEYDTASSLGSANRVENEGLSLTAEYRLNDMITFKSITAYREGASESVIDFDTSAAPALDVRARYSDEQFSQEFQLLLTGERLSGVAGLYYLDAEAAGAFDTIVGIFNATTATSGSVLTESLAAFADFSFKLNDQVSLSVGGRYTEDKRRGTVYRQNFTGLTSPLFGNAAAIPGLVRSNYTNERTFSDFTPRISLSFEPTDNLTAYVAYSEGFKSGGFDMRGDVVLTPNTVNGYDPEYVKSTEVGLKGALLAGRLNYAAAIFRADYEGQQITRQEPTLLGSIASFVDNAGSSVIQGLEIEGSLRLTRYVTASLGAGYTDAEFKEFRTFMLVGGVLTPTDLSSTAVFQNTPEWNGNATLSANVPVSNGRVGASLTASYRSDYTMFEFVSPLLDQVEDYWLIDAGVNWTSTDSGVRVALTGRNLTDERYKVGGYNFPGANFGNSVNSFYGPPRTVTLSLQLQF